MFHSKLLGPKTVTAVVEYTDARTGGRLRREFPDMLSARRFYLAKAKAGAAPKVVGGKAS